MERVELNIGGMSCGHCVKHVRQALEAVPGASVERVEVGSAAVQLDPRRTTAAQAVAAVRDAGFEASVREAKL
jgi:copper chaperone